MASLRLLPSTSGAYSRREARRPKLQGGVGELGGVHLEYQRAYEMLSDNNLTGALSALDSLLRASPQNETYIFTRALTHARLGDWASVRDDCGRALNLRDDRQRSTSLANLQYLRGLAFAKLGHAVTALRCLDACIAATPDNNAVAADADTAAAHVHAHLVHMCTCTSRSAYMVCTCTWINILANCTG